MKKGKGRPFLEIFASALHEDYRFPILEIFAFLYALGTFVFASFTTMTAASATGELTAYSVTSSLLGIGMSLFVFLILIFKNIAYGLGSDIEKGIIQTFFSYPLKRRWILSAKLLSALGVALLLFISIQISALYVLAPDVVAPYFGIVLLTYAANLSFPLLTAGIILLVTLVLRRGGLALVLGIVLYFALGIIGNLVMFVAFATKSALGLQIISVISPNFVLARYYQYAPFGGGEFWTPTFTEVLLYLGASYVIVASLFFVAYFYFSRRFGL
jgi:ABC-type transport system involved in multi-copper enzyme maturation permease subunit